ncbi:HAD family hydrolase [Rhodobacter capsulatus]|uniref:HAD family hydrolase n=1 Tax=Rhodobacter capsulatus TaxID=1061 RepID=UPI0003D2C2B0|nr:HAD family phosphatase [Rhodobacter capsulatus]ETD82846.1 hydrolase [Rhodobacter capsulatus YW1]
MSVKAVLFDCDGVLVDSEPMTFLALQEDLAAHGLDLTIPQMEALFLGGTLERVQRVANDMGAGLGPGWCEAFYARLYAMLRDRAELMPGVESLLDRLDAAGIAYAVGSNGRRAKMQASLGRHPALWARMQDRLFSGQDLRCPKPAPDLYLTAAAFLGVAPADCVVVEDSGPGAQAAQAAGMRCLGYAPQGDSAALRAAGAEIFTDLAALPGLIGLV